MKGTWQYRKCEICGEEAYKHFQGEISSHSYKGKKQDYKDKKI